MDLLPHPLPRQLRLPLDLPDAVTPSPPPLAEVVVQPRQLWRRLSPDLQRQVRQTLIQICQEVLDDSAQR
jgi:hypothetical protein